MCDFPSPSGSSLKVSLEAEKAAVSTMDHTAREEDCRSTTTKRKRRSRFQWPCRSLFVFINRQEVSLLIVAIAVSTLSAAAKTAYALILGKIFDVVAGYGSQVLDGSTTLSRVSYWCMVLTVLGVARWVVNAVFMSLWVTLGESRARVAREASFETLLAKDMPWFDNLPNGVASLVSGVQSNVRELQLATSQLLGQLVNDAILTVGTLMLAFYSSWKLTLVMLATVPPSVVIISLISGGIQPAIQAYRRELAQASKHAATSISAIELVKTYNAVDHEVWQYIEAIRKASRFVLRQGMRSSMQIGYIRFWMIILFVVGFWFGVYLVSRGEIAPGQAITAFYAVLIAFQALGNLGPQFSTMAKGVAAGRTLELLVSDTERSAKQNRVLDKRRLDEAPATIVLYEVAFAYPSNPTRLILHPTTLYFPSYETSFIVGKSGSGKSTIANLIVNFYQPTTGYVLVDGVRLPTLDEQWLRRNILLVQQPSTLFKDTFLKNVALGCSNPDGATASDVRAACDFALLQSTLLGLPHGLETQIGPGGVNLSGGQKQRLALARARLRDPSILILDEITSGLDPTNAGMLMDAIRIWRRGKTTIIITHDISQIRDDGFVHVMEQGSLVQRGYFGELAEEEDGPIQSLLQSAEASARSSTSSPSIVHRDTLHSELNPTGTEHSVLSQFLLPHANETSQPSALFRRVSIMSPRFPATATMRLEIRDLPKPRIPQSRTSMDLLEESARLVQARRSHGISRQNIASALQEMTADPEASKEKPIDPHKVSLLRVLGSVWPTLDKAGKLTFVFGVILCIIAAGLTPAFSYVFAELLASFWATNDKEAVARPWAIDLTIIAAADGVSSFLAYYLMTRVSQAWIDGLRIRSHKGILRQPKSWFDEPDHSAQHIVHCLDSRADELGKLVAIFLPIVLIAVGMVVASIIWALSISWQLSLVTLAAGPAVYLAARLAAYVSNKWETRCLAAAESTSSILAEVSSNIRVVRALTLEDHFSRQYKASSAETFRTGLKRAVRTGLPYGFNQSMADWLTALVFYYATVLLTGGAISAGGVQKVVNLLLFSIGSAAVMLGDIPQIASAKSAAGEILGFARLPLRRGGGGGGHEHAAAGRRRARPQGVFPICLRELRFAYPSGAAAESLVLRNVSLRIEAGETVAVVGPSGCGKSTLAAVLLRLYEPLDGEQVSTMSPGGNVFCANRHPDYSSAVAASSVPVPLSYGFQDARDINTSVLRSMIGYVPQHPFIFPGTVRQNILYGMRDDAPERRANSGAVERAAQAAGIHELIISLAEGYDTLVGEGGVGLSGGESQRLCIARALVRRPRLLVLDEPTSALDAVAAEGIRDLVRQLITTASRGSDRSRARGTGVVVVTHSREMMQAVDRVVMLDDGRVVEDGSYEHLVRRGGAFAQFIRRE